MRAPFPFFGGKRMNDPTYPVWCRRHHGSRLPPVMVLNDPREVAQARLEADIERQRRQDRMIAEGHVVPSDEEQQRTLDDTLTMMEWERGYDEPNAAPDLTEHAEELREEPA